MNTLLVHCSNNYYYQMTQIQNEMKLQYYACTMCSYVSLVAFIY